MMKKFCKGYPRKFHWNCTLHGIRIAESIVLCMSFNFYRLFAVGLSIKVGWLQNLKRNDFFVMFDVACGVCYAEGNRERSLKCILVEILKINFTHFRSIVFFCKVITA